MADSGGEEADLREEDWISINIYTGANPGAMDFFISSEIPEVLSCGGFDRWHFLRFFDGHGPHLRLRLRADSGNSANLKRASMLACNRGLDRLGMLPVEEYRPLVMPPGERDVAWLEQSWCAVRSASYEPELEKYGGEPGMPVAAAVFETSSQIAISVLRADLAAEYSRKTMAPCLMAIVADIFWPRNPAALWNNYATYWLGGDTAFARDWRERFLLQADRLREANTPVVAAPEELPPEAAALLADWSKALRTGHKRYQRMRTFQDFPSAQLGLHFIHMMNNRLGLSMLEEAYLATLLEARADTLTPA
jgi:thiopeptide-type bacteriocin biosynthesis protein